MNTKEQWKLCTALGFAQSNNIDYGNGPDGTDAANMLFRMRVAEANNLSVVNQVKSTIATALSQWDSTFAKIDIDSQGIFSVY